MPEVTVKMHSAALYEPLDSLDIGSSPRLRATVSPESNTAAERLAQLTDGQRDCLRLVYRHMKSKDIARALGISPHTVDMRLRTAMKTLDVANRIEAARLLELSEVSGETYQPLIYQAPDIAAHEEQAEKVSPASNGSGDLGPLDRFSPTSPVAGPAINGPPRLAATPAVTNQADWVGAGLFDPESGTRPFTSPRPWGRRNDLPIGTRLAWIAGIAIGSAMGFGAILAALAALKTLV